MNKKEWAELKEKIEIMDSILNKLTFLLPEQLRLELNKEIRSIKNRSWEKSIGYDL